ncbi:hypothetical protein CXG81DRAFT_28548 [Caulochytrium protostelioides]|uniref:DUF4050 domain-containing protein n=1 Tax=Caulochytrium protostelioides TaxID=1555241 RepID=A0A4P9X1E0_9FUNG|nr:hypothetical protein CXG81DRAFT_28548 [Caulochytrium protostelioides]|eukprot:RKO98648.1 hypothetical protein CXG81DRAFT_28548 [Caulochytrium protostelioides]
MPATMPPAGSASASASTAAPVLTPGAAPAPPPAATGVRHWQAMRHAWTQGHTPYVPRRRPPAAPLVWATTGLRDTGAYDPPPPPPPDSDAPRERTMASASGPQAEALADADAAIDIDGLDRETDGCPSPVPTAPVAAAATAAAPAPAATGIAATGIAPPSDGASDASRGTVWPTTTAPIFGRPRKDRSTSLSMSQRTRWRRLLKPKNCEAIYGALASGRPFANAMPLPFVMQVLVTVWQTEGMLPQPLPERYDDDSSTFDADVAAVAPAGGLRGGPAAGAPDPPAAPLPERAKHGSGDSPVVLPTPT